MEGLVGPFMLLIFVLLSGFWIYCLVDILVSRFKRFEKPLWLLLVLLAPVIGCLIYLLLGNKFKIKRRFDPFGKRPIGK